VQNLRKATPVIRSLPTGLASCYWRCAVIHLWYCDTCDTCSSSSSGRVGRSRSAWWTDWSRRVDGPARRVSVS